MLCQITLVLVIAHRHISLRVSRRPTPRTSAIPRTPLCGYEPYSSIALGGLARIDRLAGTVATTRVALGARGAGRSTEYVLGPHSVMAGERYCAVCVAQREGGGPPWSTVAIPPSSRTRMDGRGGPGGSQARVETLCLHSQVPTYRRRRPSPGLLSWTGPLGLLPASEIDVILNVSPTPCSSALLLDQHHPSRHSF